METKIEPDVKDFAKLITPLDKDHKKQALAMLTGLCAGIAIAKEDKQTA